MSADPRPVCEGFCWIGQSFRSCDRCGNPYWEHSHDERMDRSGGPFSGAFVLVPIDRRAADERPGEVGELLMPTDPENTREERRAELMKATKAELAEMYRSTFRVTIRPSLPSVMNGYSKPMLADRLLDMQDRCS